MKTEDLIEEALSLPVEERARVADLILQSLNPPDPSVEEKWVVEIRRRIEEVESGKVKMIPGNEVFEEIRKRFME